MELNFKENQGVSFYDRTVSDIPSLKGILDKNRPVAYFVGNFKKVEKAEQPIAGDYPLDLNAGTNMFFVKTKIFEQIRDAGVKLPLLRNIDTEK